MRSILARRLLENKYDKIGSKTVRTVALIILSGGRGRPRAFEPAAAASKRTSNCSQIDVHYGGRRRKASARAISVRPRPQTTGRWCSQRRIDRETVADAQTVYTATNRRCLFSLHYASPVSPLNSHFYVRHRLPPVTVIQRAATCCINDRRSAAPIRNSEIWIRIFISLNRPPFVPMRSAPDGRFGHPSAGTARRKRANNGTAQNRKKKIERQEERQTFYIRLFRFDAAFVFCRPPAEQTLCEASANALIALKLVRTSR